MKHDLQYRIAIASIFAAALSMLSAKGWSEDPTSESSGYEILMAKPGEKIIHSLQTKSQLDNSFRRTSLEGPFGFTHPVNGRAYREGNVFWNLYEMTYGGQSAPVSMKVRLPLGEEEQQLRLGDAKYFLTKAQWITTDSPDPLAEKIDFYKAYEVLDTIALKKELAVADSMGGPSRKILKLAFLCLPVEEHHHEEEYAINFPKRALAVYHTETEAFQSRVTTIDQFGLHSLTASGSEMLLFPCELAD
jgi:hypothetical protein